MSFLYAKEWKEPKVKRILVPVQGFPAEINTINLAFNLAEKPKAKVSILNCKERIRRSREPWLQQLAKHTEALSKSLKIPTDEERVTRVRASDAILKSSKSTDCDLIIMGAAQTRTHKRLLGSTTRRVARKSEIPVLVVASWLKKFEEAPNFELQKILLPIRSTSKDIAALRLAAALKTSSAAKDAELVALNLTSFPEVKTSTPLGAPEIKLQRELFMDDVSIFSKQSGLEITPKHLAAQKIGEAAIEFAEKEKVDLILLGAHRKPRRFGGFLGSVSYEIALKTHAAVVVAFTP